MVCNKAVVFTISFIHMVLINFFLCVQFAANSLDYKISLMGHDEKSDSYFDARDKVNLIWTTFVM